MGCMHRADWSAGGSSRGHERQMKHAIKRPADACDAAGTGEQGARDHQQWGTAHSCWPRAAGCALQAGGAQPAGQLRREAHDARGCSSMSSTCQQGEQPGRVGCRAVIDGKGVRGCQLKGEDAQGDGAVHWADQPLALRAWPAFRGSTARLSSCRRTTYPCQMG